MAGADAKAKEIVRRLMLLGDIARDIELRYIASQYGEGFAATIRREVEKRIHPRAK